MSQYVDELQRQAFLLSSAGLGVSFSLLYGLRRSVSEATYDETKNFEFLVSLVLGLASGTILAQFIPVDEVGDLGALTKPTLALIGGFSSSLVFTILTRIVASIESLFAPDAEDRADQVRRQVESTRKDVEIVIAKELVRVRSTPPAQRDVEIDALLERLAEGESLS